VGRDLNVGGGAKLLVLFCVLGQGEDVVVEGKRRHHQPGENNAKVGFYSLPSRVVFDSATGLAGLATKLSVSSRSRLSLTQPAKPG
jgi:hypothetical protein